MGTRLRAPGVTAPDALPMHTLGDLQARRRFRAMNTSIELTLLDWRRISLLDETERFFHDFEARFSRFQPESELCALNARAGAAVQVSRDMVDLLLAARAMHDDTGGLFEPAVLPALEAAGYDRSFEAVPRDAEVNAAPAARTGSIRDLRIDPHACEVTVPTGVRIDLGGIGKGYCVDRAARLLWDAGPSLINAGGDMFARGGGLDGHGWVIQVLHPDDDKREIDRVRLFDQAIATSTTAIRRWRRGGHNYHHIIDPRTNTSADSGICSVSVIVDAVIAQTATSADVYAKTALMLGYEAGARFLRERDAHGLFVLADRTVRTTDRWPAGTGR